MAITVEQALESAFVGQHIKLLNDPSGVEYLFAGRSVDLKRFWALRPEKVVGKLGPSLMLIENERLDVGYYAPCCGG